MSNPSTPRTELGHRARRILYAVVTEYIATGEPVGSRKIARRHGLSLSPASIRNVLADLEEAGYLTQPHTSAGRVPTDLGFRVFVDALVQMREVSGEDRTSILSRMKALRPGSDDILRETGRLLSSMTHAAAVVTLPRAEDERLAQLRFVPLRDGQLLAVLVTRSGGVQNRVVHITRDPSASELEQLHNYLAPLIEGRTLIEVREALVRDMALDQGHYDALRRQVKEVLDATVASSSRQADVLIEGQRVLFDRPEFADGDKIKGFLRAFEAKQELLELLDRTLAAGGVQVLIGSEASLGDVSDISVISAMYGSPTGSGGTVAIVGPTRMDYGKIVPLVGFTARVVGDVLEGEPPGDDPESQS